MAGETAGGVLLPVCVVRAGVGTDVMVLAFLGDMAVVLLRLLSKQKRFDSIQQKMMKHREIGQQQMMKPWKSGTCQE